QHMPSLPSHCSSTAPLHGSARGFLSQGCGPLRGLHSFPTRRSSDLKMLRRDDDILRRLAEQCTQGAGNLLAGQISQREGHHCDQDRKSTRLNSSHVSISYAVFCLKKKTNTSTSSGDPAASPDAHRAA